MGGYTFQPFQEQEIYIETTSVWFAKIRSIKGLRVGKSNNKEWLRMNGGIPHHDFCIAYDTNSRFQGFAYKNAIEALADPILEHLPKGSYGYSPRPGIGLNLRFFSELRIIEQGKSPVGPNDVFMSHGIGDKNYWLAHKIACFKHALVPGPAWKERIEKGGYEGTVHVVGYTKLDPLFNGAYARKKREKPYVVWAPTHAYIRKYTGRSSYPHCLELIHQIPDSYEKTVALHPAHRTNVKDKHNVTLQELLDADVVIADAGSTLYEAWALGKPVIFPDWLCKDDVIGNSKDDPGNFERRIYEEGIGYHAKDMKHLIELIEEALACGMKQPEIDFMEGIFPSGLRGKAGKTAAKALMKIKDEIGCQREG